MNKFNLSKGLLDTVSGIVKSSQQQQAEQNSQYSADIRAKTKIDTIKPLTAEQLASVPKREQKDLALHNTIRGIATASAEKAAAEMQTAEGRINSMYRTSGGRGRSLTEGKAHTVPKTEKEKQLASLATPKDKITHKDVMVGRGVIAKEEVEPVGEGWDDMLKSVKDRAKTQPNGGSGVKKGSRYGGSKQKDDESEKGERDDKSMKEEKDTPGNGYEHQCAVHVKHSKLGEGKTLFSQHADPAEDGTIDWYDVMFEHGIEKKVPTTDLEILVSEAHMNHKKKK